MTSQDISDNLPLYHTIKYRRDIIFCQAVSGGDDEDDDDDDDDDDYDDYDQLPS